MAREFLPKQFVAELLDIADRPRCHSVPDLGQREKAVTDERRQTRRTALRGRVHLVAAVGVARDIKSGKCCICSGLAAAERLGTAHFVSGEVAQVPRDVLLGCGATGPWWRQQSHGALRRRSRIGPLAVDGSTTLPRCTISRRPSATSRRAADRVGSIR